jgi:hypothetical protein
MVLAATWISTQIGQLVKTTTSIPTKPSYTRSTWRNAQRVTFNKLHPTHPKLKEDKHVEDEMKAYQDMWETWYYGFREKYPGTRGDQWVCGCSALIEESGDESEEE